jgi:hypothetical protein
LNLHLHHAVILPHYGRHRIPENHAAEMNAKMDANAKAMLATQEKMYKIREHGHQ